MPKKTDNFEKSLEELQQIAAKLEEGRISLDESIELFEKGVGLAKSCQKLLDEAEKKVSMLAADENGELVLKNFLQDGE